MAIKVYTSVAKGLKAKVRKFWGLINMSVEVTREKLIGCVEVGGGGGRGGFGLGFFAPRPS